VSVSLGAESDATWPQFREADGAGVSQNPTLPERWSTNENVAWTAEVPGRGWSSPIGWGDRVFVTTVQGEGEVELPKKGLYLGGERKKIAQATYHLPVLTRVA
jgi:hypothetical protein